MLLPG
jgi:hypothetical protein